MYINGSLIELDTSQSIDLLQIISIDGVVEPLVAGSLCGMICHLSLAL